jgi:hypothetical protein
MLRTWKNKQGTGQKKEEKEGWNKMLTLWFQRLCTISILHISSYVKTLSSVHITKLSDNQYGSLNSSSFLRFQIQDNSSSQRNTRSWGLQKTPSSSFVCLIPPPSSSKDTLSLTPHAKEPIQVSWLTPRLSLLKLNAFTKIYISWLPTAVNPEAGL